jgi:hypothetical protein
VTAGRPPVTAWPLAAAVALAVAIADPPSADLAAGAYRVALFEDHGAVLWQNGWYDGHHLPGYSVLYPPLGAWLGLRVPAALGCVAAAWAFERLAVGHWGARARPGAAWFALAVAAPMLSGRLAWALGLGAGLLALLAAARGRVALAAAGGVLTALASPVAGLFLALAAVAWWVGAPAAARRPGAPADRRPAGAAAVGAGALAAVGALVLAFPEGGVEPFAASAFWPGMGLLAATATVLGRREPVLLAGCLLSMASIAASFALDTPMGGNATRLVALVGGPLVAAALWGRRPLALALLALPYLYWQAYPAIRDVAVAADDPSVHASFYAPLQSELERRAAGRAVRVTVPFTENHWEARWLPPRWATPRGWERQLDVGRNALFYRDRPPAPAEYRRWLDDHAVAFVAVAGVPLDDAGRDEARLVTTGRVPGLREVWRAGGWRLFAVDRPAPLATGPATVTRLGAGEVELRARRAGTVLLRLRFTPYWRLAAGSGCVERTADDRVRLRLRRPGRVLLDLAFDLRRVRARGARCTA